MKALVQVPKKEVERKAIQVRRGKRAKHKNRA